MVPCYLFFSVIIYVRYEKSKKENNNKNIRVQLPQYKIKFSRSKNSFNSTHLLSEKNKNVHISIATSHPGLGNSWCEDRM